MAWEEKSAALFHLGTCTSVGVSQQCMNMTVGMPWVFFSFEVGVLSVVFGLKIFCSITIARGRLLAILHDGGWQLHCRFYY